MSSEGITKEYLIQNGGKGITGLSPQEMRKAIIRNLKYKTGKSLEEWIEIVKVDGPKMLKERHQWFKKEYHLGHFQAQIIAEKAEKRRFVPNRQA